MHTNGGKYTKCMAAPRQQMHAVSNNNHTICHCPCPCTRTSVQRNCSCSMQSHLPGTAPFWVLQCYSWACTGVERCLMHSFSKALAGMGRTSEWEFPRTTLVFLSSEGSGHNEGAAHVGQYNAVGTARKQDIGVLQEK